MFGHVTLGCDNWDRARPFWMAVMEVLGHPVFRESEAGAAFGEVTGQKTFVGPAFNGEAAAAGNGVHIAYLVKDRATVDAFHAAALASGGTDEGPPGLRSHYHPNYYGAYVRDPDGNKLQAVCHSAKG
ncbi:VOC family protein [Parasphingopyxis lamellibrachiae]|uniref:Catechol 2,3-dioxygenase-like lactoylglutathione lyase family enzyme n=1 Tax=Parasphingopyxis lamellibrachiae TaxID=680125 RepID=A0A3D9FIK9_9SPHN|nr:VOC family protein [Parasphingopyxis lamellibrachiae]RED17615.1 catechol 2,3-dioxygenase-like lactoylglutathione lyase family enzyme [Parasphingopyxis lamellibrachiae]